MLSGVGDCMIVRPREGRPSLGEGESIAVREKGGRGGGRLSAADSARLRPLSDGTGKGGLLFAGGWSERRDAAGRVHAIAFFEKNTG